MNFNYLIADLVAKLNLAMSKRHRFLRIVKNNISLRLLYLLYRHGIIRTFRIHDEYIIVFFKYIRGWPVCKKLTIVSKPSKRAYWTLNKLTKNYNTHNFSGFYIISTSKGIITTDYALLEGHMAGEILIKVEL